MCCPIMYDLNTNYILDQFELSKVDFDFIYNFNNKNYDILIQNKKYYQHSKLYLNNQLKEKYDLNDVVCLIKIFGFFKICIYQNISQTIIIDYLKNISKDQEFDWYVTSKYFSNIDINFIAKYKNKLSLEFLLQNVNLSEKTKNYISKIYTEQQIKACL